MIDSCLLSKGTFSGIQLIRQLIDVIGVFKKLTIVRLQINDLDPTSSVHRIQKITEPVTEKTRKQTFAKL